MKIKRLLFMVCLSMVFALPGCIRSPQPEEPAVEPSGSAAAEESEPELESSPEHSALEQQALEIAAQYQTRYRDAEKEKEEFFPYDTVLSQSDIDAIEEQLIGEGYPVINSDETVPSYLANAEAFYAFWEAAARQEEAQVQFLSLSASGALHVQQLEFRSGTRTHTSVLVDWDADGQPYLSSTEQRDILDWELTEAGNFYFQIVPSDGHYDDYSFVRLTPVDEALYDLTEKYILPIGYQSNNLFLCDWDRTDYGALCFNDLFEFFYRVQYGEYYTGHSGNIPSSLFESVIKPYFSISLEEFRERSLYAEDLDCYPWHEIGSDNLTYYASLAPEVTEKQENDDGTFTLVVDVRCNDYKEDRLFTHEVTIQPLEDGGYQYVGNRISYQSEYGLPNYVPRLPQGDGSSDDNT